MLNEELFEDGRDAEIARLRMAIGKFKEYDRKRKEYYSAHMERLGELEAFVQEVEAAKSDGNTELTIDRLKLEVRRLNMKIQAGSIAARIGEEEAVRIIDTHRILCENRRLKEEIRYLHKAISEYSTKKATE